MGLADMMSPGESKLSTPLKADGKEEGVSQPESKSKVLPPPCTRGHCLQGGLAVLCLVLTVSPLLPLPLSAVFPAPPQSHGVGLKVTNSYSIESQCGKGGDLAKRCCWGSKGFIYIAWCGYLDPFSLHIVQGFLFWLPPQQHSYCLFIS